VIASQEIPVRIANRNLVVWRLPAGASAPFQNRSVFNRIHVDSHEKSNLDTAALCVLIYLFAFFTGRSIRVCSKRYPIS
jgi:hypothetical protein